MLNTNMHSYSGVKYQFFFLLILYLAIQSQMFTYITYVPYLELTEMLQLGHNVPETPLKSDDFNSRCTKTQPRHLL